MRKLSASDWKTLFTKVKAEDYNKFAVNISKKDKKPKGIIEFGKKTKNHPIFKCRFANLKTAA